MSLTCLCGGSDSRATGIVFTDTGPAAAMSRDSQWQDFLIVLNVALDVETGDLSDEVVFAFQGQFDRQVVAQVAGWQVLVHDGLHFLHLRSPHLLFCYWGPSGGGSGRTGRGRIRWGVKDLDRGLIHSLRVVCIQKGGRVRLERGGEQVVLWGRRLRTHGTESWPIRWGPHLCHVIVVVVHCRCSLTVSDSGGCAGERGCGRHRLLPAARFVLLLDWDGSPQQITHQLDALRCVVMLRMRWGWWGCCCCAAAGQVEGDVRISCRGRQLLEPELLFSKDPVRWKEGWESVSREAGIQEVRWTWGMGDERRRWDEREWGWWCVCWGKTEEQAFVMNVMNGNAVKRTDRSSCSRRRSRHHPLSSSSPAAGHRPRGAREFPDSPPPHQVTGRQQTSGDRKSGEKRRIHIHTHRLGIQWDERLKSCEDGKKSCSERNPRTRWAHNRCQQSRRFWIH